MVAIASGTSDRAARNGTARALNAAGATRKTALNAASARRGPACVMSLASTVSATSTASEASAVSAVPASAYAGLLKTRNGTMLTFLHLLISSLSIHNH